MVGCFAYADTALANSCLRGGFEFLATDPVFDKAVTGEIYIRERAND